MRTWKQKHPFHCPQCNYDCDSVSDIDSNLILGYLSSHPPRAGDLSVCLNCGQLLTFCANLTLRKLNPDEIRDLMRERRTWDLIEKCQFVIHQRGKFA